MVTLPDSLKVPQCLAGTMSFLPTTRSLLDAMKAVDGIVKQRVVFPSGELTKVLEESAALARQFSRGIGDSVYTTSAFERTMRTLDSVTQMHETLSQLSESAPRSDRTIGEALGGRALTHLQEVAALGEAVKRQLGPLGEVPKSIATCFSESARMATLLSGTTVNDRAWQAPVTIPLVQPVAEVYDVQQRKQLAQLTEEVRALRQGSRELRAEVKLVRLSAARNAGHDREARAKEEGHRRRFEWRLLIAGAVGGSIVTAVVGAILTRFL